MTRSHTIIIVVVAAIVLAITGTLVYQIYLVPAMALRNEQGRIEREAVAQAAIPDPKEAAFQATLSQAADLPDSQRRKIWDQYLKNHSKDPRAADARALLGPLNRAALLSKEPSLKDKVVYTVVSGDSLYRIAQQHDTTIDLIARANRIKGTMLQIGQELVLPIVKISASADLGSKTLRLDNHGEFFCEYPLLSAQIGSIPAGGASCRVLDNIATFQGKRVTFAEEGYPEASRRIILSPPALSISGISPETKEDKMPPGLVLKKEAINDVFVLLRRGDPVTIR